MATRLLLLVRMTMVPPRIHMLSARAVALKNPCTSPSPYFSATCNLSPSLSPMKEKFSGRQATSAPASLASRNSAAADARFSATMWPEVI